MTESIRNLPRYIRHTDAFGWQGADSADGPWRSIPPPQSGTPWQTTNPMNALRQASAEVSGVAVLSPAALIILDRFSAIVAAKGTELLALAAALRAAADQVVPLEQYLQRRGMRPGGTGALSPDEGAQEQRAATRRQLLAIAAELEGQ